MAIIIQRKDNDAGKPTAVITFDNGDLTVFDIVKTKWKFKDEASMLRFLLAVMQKSNSNKVYDIDDTGKLVTLAPADDLLELAEK